MSFRYYNVSGLIILILVLALGIDSLLVKYFIPWMKANNIEILRAPGNASLILMFLNLYDNFLWKWPLFSKLVKVSDISGRYKGKIAYRFNDQDGEKECVVEISQTSSKIKVHSYFEGHQQTDSKSLVETIEEEDGFFKVYSYYFNSGTKENDTLDCHEGVNVLKFVPPYGKVPQSLEGHYFTSRKIQTRGKMKVTFESKELKGIF